MGDFWKRQWAESQWGGHDIFRALIRPFLTKKGLSGLTWFLINTRHLYPVCKMISAVKNKAVFRLVKNFTRRDIPHTAVLLFMK